MNHSAYSNEEFKDAILDFLISAFLYTEGIEIKGEASFYSYAYRYAIQIDMGDGKGFQTAIYLPNYTLEQAQAEAQRVRFKRKRPQRIVRHDYFTTIIAPAKSHKERVTA